MKKILIVNPFDKLPNENFRDQRYTSLYEKLKVNGNDVRWWSMDFHHWSHSSREPEGLDARITLFSVPHYKKNISLARFFCNWVFAVKVYKKLLTEKNKPDVIISLPVPELIFLLALYCKGKKIKLIIDITDVWPDLYVGAFPKGFKWLGNLMILPFHKMANYAYRNANHITAVSETYRKEIVKRSGDVSKSSSVFYLGAPDSSLELGNKQRDDINVLFCGQFEYSYDVGILMEAALRCKKEGIRVNFLLAGSGSKKEGIDNFIKVNSLENVKLLGWLNVDDLMGVAAGCHIGVSCYNDFATQSIPTKYFDYMSMGLVVMNSLSGEMSEIIKSDGSGVNYIANDIQDFYTKLKVLTLDVEGLIEIGHNNRKLYEEKYCFSKIYDKMVSQIF